MTSIDYIAGQIYEAYCQSVGGVAFNGDPLPKWEDFAADPQKQKQVQGWIAAATRAHQICAE